MTVEYHPAVQRDFNDALAYYEQEAGSHVADRFETEFRHCVEAIKTGPGRFARYQQSLVFRRIRLPSFPYILIYRPVSQNSVRVTLLRHERRHPLYGMWRW
jgi:toxin ParE1/3/4